MDCDTGGSSHLRCPFKNEGTVCRTVYQVYPRMDKSPSA